MSSDSFGDSGGPGSSPSPPRKNVEEGSYALGIWKDGQTLYEFEQNPLRDASPTWNKVDHFGHNDTEVQRINFQSATAEPQSSDGGSLQAVWVYTEELGRGESVKIPTEKGTEGQNKTSRPGGSHIQDSGREVGEIGKNTTYHRALSAVDRLSTGEDDAVSVNTVQQECPDPKGTVYSAMTSLHEKKS